MAAASNRPSTNSQPGSYWARSRSPSAPCSSQARCSSSSSVPLSAGRKRTSRTEAALGSGVGCQESTNRCGGSRAGTSPQPCPVPSAATPARLPEAHGEDRGRLGLRRRVRGEHEPMRRVPSEDRAPAVLGAVGGDLDQPAADAALEAQLLHALAGDRVGGDGPPLADAAREEV